MAARESAYCIDASIYIFRAYFSMPEVWFSPDGYALNAVHGYTRFLLNTLPQLSDRVVGVAFDESLGTCFRNDVYPGYKSSRALPDESLAFQLEACRQVSELLGLFCHASQTYEADDILATMARRNRAQGRRIVIVSRDKDLAQLVLGEGDCLWDPAGQTEMDAAAVQEKFGVAPADMVDLQTLIGDKSDDIPGIKGLGIKTAAALINEFGSVEAIVELAENEPDRLLACKIRGIKGHVQRLLDHREQLQFVPHLVRLVDNIDEKENGLSCLIEGMNWQVPISRPLCDYLSNIGFGERFVEGVGRDLDAIAAET